MKNSFRILIIDDNPDIHQDFIKILTNVHHFEAFHMLEQQLLPEELINNQLPELPIFQVDCALQGQDGVDMVLEAQKENLPYAVAFVDMRLPPGIDGIETIKKIWEIDKQIQVVICTAFSDYTWEETIKALGVRDNLLILKKPFDRTTVRQLASTLTKKWWLAAHCDSYPEVLTQKIAEVEKKESLENSLTLLKATFESTMDGYLVLDLKGNLINYNSHFKDIWSIREKTLASKEGTLIVNHMILQATQEFEFKQKIEALDKNIRDSSQFEVMLRNGKFIECSTHPYKINRKIVGRVWTFRDITERTYLERKLEYQATHDSLTGLPNRVLLMDRINQCIAAATRQNKCFAVFFFDFDRFKLINDSFSHEAGDKLLCDVARRLNGLVREEDTLARLGGDEFIMLIPSLQNSDDVINIAQKIIQSFQDPFLVGDKKIKLSASIGISIFPDDGLNASNLLRNADLGMYYAKELGGNQFRFYTPNLNQKSMLRLSQEQELRKALLNEEFFLVYQPQYDGNTRKINAVEALLRWNHREKGIILPLEFIPIAEDSGIIVPLGEWVIEQITKQFKEWYQYSGNAMHIGINLSVQQLRQGNLINVIRNALKKNDMPANCLEIEVNEHLIVKHPDVKFMLEALKELGVVLILDNFGIDSASLGYLKEIDVDCLKIGDPFITNLTSNPIDASIVEALIAMAKSFNFKVIAERIENKNQLDFLKKYHCDRLQGFYFTKPMTAEMISNLIYKSYKSK